MKKLKNGLEIFWKKMKMKDEIIKIDSLLGMIENGDQFVSMIFVKEFHNPNVLN